MLDIIKRLEHSLLSRTNCSSDFLINRQWLGIDGIVLKTYDTMDKALCLSKEEAIAAIQQHIELNKLIESECLESIQKSILRKEIYDIHTRQRRDRPYQYLF